MISSFLEVPNRGLFLFAASALGAYDDTNRIKELISTSAALFSIRLHNLKPRV